MCSYLASFPAALAHAFIARYSRPGDVVLDPFSGRGTTPLQACAEGRIGVGNDLNPFAHLLTAAKVEPATRAQAATRLAQLRLAWNASSRRTGWPSAARVGRRSDGARRPSCRLAGSGRGPADGSNASRSRSRWPSTRGRSASCCSSGRRSDLDDRTDRFLAAALTGILHGKSASYLSELMPNTFIMAPRYVRDFAARTAFASPERDVFDGLAQEARPALPPAAAVDRGHRPARRRPRRRAAGPGRAARAAAAPERARLVVTSPPYLRVVKYGYYNWLRTWFLGFDARAIDATLDDAHHREPYLAFLRDVLAGLRPVLADDAVVVLVIGDVETDRGRRDPRRGRPGRAGLGGRRRARGLPAGRRRARRRRRASGR